MISSVLHRFGGVVGAVLLSTGLFAEQIDVTTTRTYTGWMMISGNTTEIWHVKPGGAIVVNRDGPGNQYISIENKNPSELWLEGGTISSGTLALRGVYSTYRQYSGTMTLSQPLLADAGTVMLYGGVCTAAINFRSHASDAKLQMLGGTLKAASIYGDNMKYAEFTFAATNAYVVTGNGERPTCFAITATTPITQAPKSIAITGTPVSGCAYALVDGLANDAFFSSAAVTVPAGWQLLRRGRQLLLVETASLAVVSATWTGAAGDGNPRTPGNWTCLNAAGEEVTGTLPGINATAYVPAEATDFSFPADKVISLNELRFLGTTYTLGGDADWSGIAAGLVGKFPGKIDVNGHQLKVSEEPAVTPTDLTMPGGNIRVTYLNGSVIAGGDNSSPAFLVDDNPVGSSRFLCGNFKGCYIDYDFGEGFEKVVRGVRLYIWGLDRAPKDLTVYGTTADPATAEEGDWTQLATWTSLSFATDSWSSYLNLGNETKYRAYRLKINSNVRGDQYGNYLELYEMELVNNLPAAVEVTDGATYTAPDLTTPGGTINVTYLNGSWLAGSGNSAPAGLIDDKYSGSGVFRFLCGSFKGCLIDYDFGAGQGQIVRGARFYCTSVERSPQDITVYGTMVDPATATDSDWTRLALWPGPTTLRNGNWSDYQGFDNETAYRAYRLKIDDNVKADGYGDYFELYELELVENVPPVGELRYVVPAGKTVRNTTATLSGSLKVVKEGEGALIFGKLGQTFRGGVDVQAGIVWTEVGPGGWPFGGSPLKLSSASTITVHEGALLDLRAASGWAYTTIVMDGGEIVGRSEGLNPQFALTASSKLRLTDNVVLKGALADMNGNTLTIEIPDGKVLDCYLTAAANGVFDVVHGGWFYNRNVLDARTVDLKMNAALNLVSDMSVRDYDAKWNTAANLGSAALNVYGTFTPHTDYFYGCTLQDGASIDLSEKTGEWVTTSKSDARATVDFADNAHVTIVLGERRPSLGERLVYWSETPANLATLSFVATYDDSEFTGEPLFVTPTGIFYGCDPNKVDRAYWTGEADGDLFNFRNWACTNVAGVGVADARPDTETTVYFCGNCALDIPSESTFACKQVVCTGTMAFTADCDWRGLPLDHIAAGSRIDLAGHVLQLVGTAAGTPKALTITDTSSGNPGELRLTVAEGVTFSNDALALTGNLRLVKDGAGAFVAKVASQSYTGGTVVAGGTFTCGVSEKNVTPLGQSGAPVTVNGGCVYDLGGYVGLDKYPFTLVGGTIQNSGADGATIGSITLTDDSTINFPNVGGGKNDIYVASDSLWDLGGHQLSITFAGNDPDLFFRDVTNVTIRNGTIKTTGNGCFHDYIGVDASDRVTYDSASQLRLKGNATVSNFINRTTFRSVASRKTDFKTDVWLTLSGAFTPLSPYCFNVRLLDGAKIDLSERETAWPLESNVTYDTIGNYTTRTDFADNATITVDLGARMVKAGDQIIAWQKANKPENGVKFKLASGQGSLQICDDGLYLRRAFMLIIR